MINRFLNPSNRLATHIVRGTVGAVSLGFAFHFLPTHLAAGLILTVVALAAFRGVPDVLARDAVLDALQLPASAARLAAATSSISVPQANWFACGDTGWSDSMSSTNQNANRARTRSSINAPLRARGGFGANVCTIGKKKPIAPNVPA
jgi:hypothetical protein